MVQLYSPAFFVLHHGRDRSAFLLSNHPLPFFFMSCLTSSLFHAFFFHFSQHFSFGSIMISHTLLLYTINCGRRFLLSLYHGPALFMPTNNFVLLAVTTSGTTGGADQFDFILCKNLTHSRWEMKRQEHIISLRTKCLSIWISKFNTNLILCI